MKPCPHCGGENRDQARFCGHCGRPFTIDTLQQEELGAKGDMWGVAKILAVAVVVIIFTYLLVLSFHAPGKAAHH